jgi:ubiquinone/menaquinone biosynthesis C-methylase UbiE
MPGANDYDKYAAMRQKELQQGTKLPHRYVEKPAMQKLLPDLKGKRVLMLGCGTGEESAMLSEVGAAELTGIDISAESIKLARKTYPQHTFQVGDMHQLDFPDGHFDFVYSSLTIHYSAEPEKVYAEIHRVLTPDGSLQFSVGHPLRWASETIDIDGASSRILGFSCKEDSPRLYGTYSTLSKHSDTFSSGEVLEFWVGPPSLHFNLLKQSGFAVQEFVETRAIEECREVDPYYYERFHEFPQFMVYVANKPSN